MSFGRIDMNDLTCPGGHGIMRPLPTVPMYGCEACDWSVTKVEVFSNVHRNLKGLIAAREVGRPLSEVVR